MQQLWSFATQDLAEELAKLCTSFSPSDKISVAWISVAKEMPIESWDFWQYFDSKPHFLPINSDFFFPIENLYATPKTLGIDRIVAVIAAKQLFPNVPILVIDAGTAITYDFANEKGQYLGGGIAAGIKMKFRALHEFTARLPLIEERNHCELIGNSTYNSMLSGVINGTIAEIQGIISQYQQQFGENIHICMTGGDAEFLAEKLRDISLVDVNLVLKGVAFLMDK